MDFVGNTKSVGRSEGVMAVFPFLYKMLAWGALLMFGLAIMLSSIDLFKFVAVETTQKIKTIRANYNFQVDDSNEYKLLDYASKYLTSEPYLVYLQQDVLNLAMSLVGCAIVLFAFQMVVFLILKIRAAVNQQNYGDQINFEEMKMSFMILGIVFVGGIIMVSIYKTFFQKAYQNVAANIKQEFSGIDATIKNGLTRNMAFISALKNHNMPLVYQIFGQYAANAKTTNNYTEIQNLFFTMSVFNYFDSMSPASSDARKQAMELFSSDNKNVLPHTLFFYQGNNNITNVFHSLVKDENHAYRPEFGHLGSAKMLELASQTETIIKDVNDALLKLKKPTPLKFTFLIYIMIYHIVAAGIFGAMIWMLYKTNRLSK